jgi:hypothetical protein
MANVNGATTPANTIDTEIMLTRDYIAQRTAAIALATPTASGSQLVKWDASGRIQAVGPDTPFDVANKGYVDSVVAAINLSWGSISGKPSTFPPSAHNHDAGNITSGTITRPVSTSGEGRFGAAWNNNIVSTRRAVWMEADGTLGHTASARKFKQDIRPAELTFEQLRAIPVVLYRYRKQVAAEKAGKIDHAATEIGTLADDLHDLGLWQFVIYDNDGAPLSVHYELLALAALSLGQQLADRVEAFDARLTALEDR